MPCPPVELMGGMREATLAEKLDVVRAFAEVAKTAPVWQKGPAIEQAVEGLIQLLADIIEIIEGEQHEGN